jgi:hypothetical protein
MVQIARLTAVKQADASRLSRIAFRVARILLGLMFATTMQPLTSVLPLVLAGSWSVVACRHRAGLAPLFKR